MVASCCGSTCRGLGLEVDDQVSRCVYLGKLGLVMVFGWERLNRAEAALVEALPGLPARPAHPVLIAVTVVGRAGGLWLFLCAMEAMRPGGDRRGAGHGCLAVGVALVVSHLVKRLVPHRPRPMPPGGVARRGLPERPDSSSFPSAHAATAAAFTVVTAAHHWRLVPLVAPLTIMATYGRLRTRVHWPSDVLAGTVLGVGSALVTAPRSAGS